MNYEQIGKEIGALVDKKNASYGSSFDNAGEILKILYPESIGVEQYTDVLAIIRIIDKLFRIANDKTAFNEEPWKDIAGYGLVNVRKIPKIKGEKYGDIVPFFSQKNNFYNNNNIKDIELFESYAKEDTLQNFHVESLYGIQEGSLLSHVFFSRQNLNRIQEMIRYEVYVKSNKKYVIDRQSDVALQIVMRSIYLQHSPNLPNKIKEQVEYLDKLVTDWSVEQILPEVEQYMGYLSEIEYMPTPIDLPRDISSKGTRSLRSVTTTF